MSDQQIWYLIVGLTAVRLQVTGVVLPQPQMERFDPDKDDWARKLAGYFVAP